ncbi:MAG: AAA family ATPase [Candidatus Lokiarchaeota archaeon]|nr:AAA family ATPase [Candidatus Lokiarchaeota archaeon]
MILESIEISNIRSIRNEEIKFPSSTMLFFGDVGSGKSSVLKSIEFALFGTLTHADLSGDSLLRRGKGTASVNLTFLIDGKKYSIKRSLSKDRKGNVSQKECVFIDHDNGTSITYAPTDMRRKILSLLSYSVPRYEKATKLPLFRYTVYTPQEQIKEIIQAEPDDRFEILKEVFGIEKYEITLRNIDFIKDFLNDRVKEYKIRIEQIGDPEEKILQQKKEIVQTKQKISKIENEISTKEKDITSQELVVEEFQKDLDNFLKKFAQIENKESNILEYRAKQKKIKTALNKIQKEIVEKEGELKELKDIIIPTKLSEAQLESQLEQLQNLKSQKEKESAVVKKVLADVDKLLKEGKCALCGQAIHEKDRFEKEFQEAKIKIGNLTNEIDNLLLKVNEQKKLLKIKRESQKVKNKKDSLNNLISEKQKRLTDLNSRINELFVNINNNQEDILTILSKYKNTNLLKFKGMGEEIKVKLKTEKKALNELSLGKESSGKELSAQNKTLEYLQKELAEINSNIELKKEIQGDLTHYSQLKNWVGEGFPVLIRDIEKRILSSSAHQFNSYFKEWFHELVEDRNIEVEIKTDDFQPIIHVNGYESPFKDLSGGEKSALSLAYRLALNKIINERYQEVKTKGLLILDEPTDGFSQQQINRMQPIFEKLNTSQMIIISHERNLDSFVTDIFHFQKENHITKVKKETS